MKLNHKIKTSTPARAVKPLPKTKRHAARGTAYADVREEFLALKPVDLSKIGAVFPKNMRPHISLLAKQSGIDYITVSLDEDTVVAIVTK